MLSKEEKQLERKLFKTIKEFAVKVDKALPTKTKNGKELRLDKS